MPGLSGLSNHWTDRSLSGVIRCGRSAMSASPLVLFASNVDPPEGRAQPQAGSRHGTAGRDRTKKGRPEAALDRFAKGAQRFENWKLRRAFFLPYFFRSTTRE